MANARNIQTQVTEGATIKLSDMVSNYELIRFDWYPFQTSLDSTCYVTSWCHIPITGNYQRIHISESCAGSTHFYNTTISWSWSGVTLKADRCRYWGSNGTNEVPNVKIGTIYGYKHVT